MHQKCSSVETVWRYVLKLRYIMQGRDLVKKVRKHCKRCRHFRRKAINIEIGPLLTNSSRITPAFYAIQVDICGHFKAYSLQKNSNQNLASCLLLTLIKVMEDCSTKAFIQSFVRSSCEIGYPKLLSVNERSQLVKERESMKLNYTDIKYKLHKDSLVEFDTCPVGGRNYNGKFERRIRQIKESFEKNIQNERLSVLQ